MSNRFAASFRYLMVAALLLGGASYATLKTRTGDWTGLWQAEPLGAISAEGGAAFSARTGRIDLGGHVRTSPAQVLENGQRLGPSNADHADIQARGRGRFSFWHERVLFSTSDNSDPRTNGRQYSIWYPPVGRTAARALYALTVVVWLVAAAVLGWLLRADRGRWLRDQVARAAGGLAIGAAGAERQLRRWAGPRSVSWLLAAAWLLTIGLLAASEAAFLTRTAQWTGSWREEPIGAIAPEIGHAFVGHTGRPEIGSQDAPAPTALLEDGVQIGMRNALHAEIREVGLGRYSFWHDQVYFAASDNSDPRTNGRRYTMSFPPISRMQARALYVLTAVMLVVTLALSGVAVQGGLLGAIPLGVFNALRVRVVPLLVVASTGALVLAAVLRSFPATAPAATQLWVPVLAINIASAWAFRAWYGTRPPKALLGAFVVALCVGFYYLTAWAPQRLQGCHTTDPYPAWDMFCVAPDSSSYYFKYTSGSTRQPLYPWFIEALTAGTEFSPQAYLASTPPGAIRTDAGDPLMRVVRAQILLMLAGAIVACVGLMALLGSPLPAAVLLWLYDMQYFTALELNIVLTETLVQAFLFLLVGAFAAFLAKRRHGALVLAGAACGLAYLTRQASAYGALLLVVMIVLAIVEDWRRWWRTSLASLLVFAALAAVPDIYTSVQTGSLGKNQESLQYQYRIAHAMQYATIDDVALMPDQESREWLAEAVARRDAEHRKVRETYEDEYNRMVYYINANLYAVATPPDGYHGVQKTPQFFMAVATPILIRHWAEYLEFAFRFWRFGIARTGLARLGLYDFSPWLTYAVLGLFMVLLRDLRALAGAALVLAHWGAVALTSLFAVPIPRMVWASEFLVILAAMVLVWGAAERTIRIWQGVPAGPGPDPGGTVARS